MPVICNFIVISLFLNELNLNLAEEGKFKGKKSANKYVAQNLIFFIIFHKRETLDSDFGRFLAKHLLRIRLPWKKLGSLVTQKNTK